MSLLLRRGYRYRIALGGIKLFSTSFPSATSFIPPTEPLAEGASQVIYNKAPKAIVGSLDPTYRNRCKNFWLFAPMALLHRSLCSICCWQNYHISGVHWSSVARNDGLSVPDCTNVHSAFICHPNEAVFRVYAQSAAGPGNQGSCQSIGFTEKAANPPTHFLIF